MDRHDPEHIKRLHSAPEYWGAHGYVLLMQGLADYASLEAWETVEAGNG